MPTFVTDRTKDDVDRARYIAELINSGQADAAIKAEWNAPDNKGFYNASDFARVTDQLTSIVSLLSTYYSTNVNITTRTWTEPVAGTSNAPTKADYDNYGDAIRKIVSTVGLRGYDFFWVPYRMDYNKANEIEQALEIIYNALDASKNHVVMYSGEYYAGEGGL